MFSDFDKVTPFIKLMTACSLTGYNISSILYSILGDCTMTYHSHAVKCLKQTDIECMNIM